MKQIGRQHGTTTVEFAVVGLVAVMLLFGVIEIARAMFTLNTLTEATRRAVRVAVVCPINDPAIIQAATFGDWGTAPLNLNAGNFTVEYLNTAGNVIGNPIEPVVKLTANPRTAREMSEHVDLDVSGVLRREMNFDQAGDALIDIMIRTCNGRLTCAEALGHNEFVMTKLYRSA